ncbi:MAG: FlgD immunoglobulin-like domain containing protein [Candidatus Eisenbacteria bacterium]
MIRRLPSILAGAALLLALALGGAVWGEEPVLAIYVEGGAHTCYPVSEIERVDFLNDTLRVVTGGALDLYPLVTIQRIDFSDIVTGIQNPAVAAALPKILNLFPNQPNPFSRETRIAFQLPDAGAVQLKIYGVNGRLVRTLVEGEQPSGPQRVIWDGRDNSGQEVPAGVYFSQLTAAGVTESRKMVLLR